MDERALVVGIDLSTQSCTVEARRAADMSVVARARTPLPPTSPPVSEHDARVWWAALEESFRILGEGVELASIAAMSVSGQCHGLVALDEAGEPVRPVKLWNDTSTAAHLEKLLGRVDARMWIERTGSRPTAAFTISKLAWFLAEEPESAARTRTILLPHDYINFRLTGRFATERSEASGTGYFDSEKNAYDFELLRLCFGDAMEWESLFPEVLGPNERLGEVTADAARALGISAGIPVAVGGGDQHIAALGLGIASGDVVFSLGTSGVVIASSDTPVRDPNGRVDGVANAVGGWLPLVCSLNSTKVTDWFARVLGIGVRELDELALAAEIAAPGPAFAAYLDGERTPAYPLAAGVITGLTGETTRSTLARSVFEGVLSGLVRGMGAIEACGVDVSSGKVIAIGGGARSAAYTTILADLLGRPVEVIGEPEATARGACLQALALLRGEDVAEVAVRFRPEPDRIIDPREGGRRWTEVEAEYMRACGFAAVLDRSAF